MRRFSLSYIPPALGVVATECERTSAERDAFGTFHDRLEALDTSRTDSAGVAVQQSRPPLALKPPPHTPLQRTREAYRETVMSVPHYAEEYGESFAENLAAEFGPTVSRAMTMSDALTPPLRERLLAASQQAHDDYARLLSALGHEADALQTARKRLREVVDHEVLTTGSFHLWSDEELAEASETVRRGEQRCDEVASERQTTLHTDRMPGLRRTEMSLHVYLYQSLSVTHPVLADSAELAAALRRTHDRVDRADDARGYDGQRVGTGL